MISRGGSSNDDSSRKLSQSVSIHYNPFDILPDEMVVHILSYLPLPHLFSSIWPIGNKRIRALCRRPSLWRVICLGCCCSNLDSGRKILEMAGDNLKVLHLRHDQKCDRDESHELAIQALTKSNPRLEWLQVDCTGISPAVFSALHESPSLRKLTLGTLRPTDRGSYFLSGGGGLYTPRLSRHVSCLSNLIHLDMHWADMCVVEIEEGRWVRDLSDTCGRLEQMAFPLFSLGLRDEVLIYFLKKVSGTITVLSVGEASRLTDVFYAHLRDCRLLRKLAIPEARKLGADGLRAIAELSSNLQELAITRGTFAAEKFTQAFSGKSLGSLRRLMLEYCHDIDDDAMQAFVTNSPRLENVWLRGCSRIGDRSVATILSRCKDLTELGLSRSTVTDVTLLGNNKLKAKRKDCMLDLSMMITEFGVQHISQEITPLSSHPQGPQPCDDSPGQARSYAVRRITFRSFGRFVASKVMLAAAYALRGVLLYLSLRH